MIEDYRLTATTLEGIAVIAEVDFTLGKQLTAEHNVKTLPTLKLFSHGQFVADFRGNRIASQMTSFVISTLGLETSTRITYNDVVTLTNDNFHSIVDNGELVFIKFYTAYVIIYPPYILTLGLVGVPIAKPWHMIINLQQLH